MSLLLRVRMYWIVDLREQESAIPEQGSKILAVRRRRQHRNEAGVVPPPSCRVLMKSKRPLTRQRTSLPSFWQEVSVLLLPPSHRTGESVRHLRRRFHAWPALAPSETGLRRLRRHRRGHRLRQSRGTCFHPAAILRRWVALHLVHLRRRPGRSVKVKAKRWSSNRPSLMMCGWST